MEQRRLQSQHEAGPDPEEVNNDPVGGDALPPEREEAPIPPEDGGRIVEVGDHVTYCFVDEPDQPRSIRIVDGPGDPVQGLINKETSLAQVLLGLSKGEEDHFTPPGGNQPRQLRIVGIQRTRTTLPETDPATPHDRDIPVTAYPKLELYDRGVRVARASWQLVRMVVLRGSRVRQQVGESLSQALRDRRRELVETGVLEGDSHYPGYYVFTKDVSFEAPSAASSLIYGRSDNGKRSWRVEGGGESFSDWEQRSLSGLNWEDF